MKKLNTEYDCVVIVDCLSEGERNKFDDSRLLAKFLADQGINHRYCYCGNKKTVFYLLEKLEKVSSLGLSFPIVFISHCTHLSLSVRHRKEDIDWGELRNPLKKINKNMKGNLFVLMACCEGFGGYKIDQRDVDDESFFGIIGPVRRIDLDESIKANEIFFHGLIDGKTVPDAVKDINNHFGEELYRSLISQDNKLK